MVGGRPRPIYADHGHGKGCKQSVVVFTHERKCTRMAAQPVQLLSDTPLHCRSRSRSSSTYASNEEFKLHEPVHQCAFCNTVYTNIAATWGSWSALVSPSYNGNVDLLSNRDLVA
eukprot:COSAG02_NODE_2156_length_9643_cov_55.052761_8_plen_115_part_00